MSQFDTLSKDFQESLRKLGDELDKGRDKGQAGPGDAVKLAHAFVEGPVRIWYESLDDQDKGEVSRVLSEVSSLDANEVMAMMRSQSSATPFSFLGSFFFHEEEPSGIDVVEDEGN